MTAPERVEALVRQVVESLGLQAEVTVTEPGPDQIDVQVQGDDLGAFIGRHGTTIDAVGHLAFKVAAEGAASGPRVNLDAAGYRERRRAVLQRQADEAAEAVGRDGRTVSLEPMSAIERKVVHEHLAERGGVETWSEGTEPERYLVVGPPR